MPAQGHDSLNMSQSESIQNLNDMECKSRGCANLKKRLCRAGKAIFILSLCRCCCRESCTAVRSRRGKQRLHITLTHEEIEFCTFMFKFLYWDYLPWCSFWFSKLSLYSLDKECLSLFKWASIPIKWSLIIETMTWSKSSSSSVQREIAEWPWCFFTQGFSWIQFRVTLPYRRKPYSSLSLTPFQQGLTSNTGVCLILSYF